MSVTALKHFKNKVVARITFKYFTVIAYHVTQMTGRLAHASHALCMHIQSVDLTRGT